jgi:hypothetical protein
MSDRIAERPWTMRLPQPYRVAMRRLEVRPGLLFPVLVIVAVGSGVISFVLTFSAMQ